MSLVADLHEYRLGFQHETRHEGQSEDGTIFLKRRNQTTGAMNEAVVVLEDGWSKERVKLALGGFLEVFQVAESLLTDEQAESVGLVTHGSKNFKVKLSAKPSGFDRYYIFEIQPV